jgi:tetratricopeptide (TPR) repeat protein
MDMTKLFESGTKAFERGNWGLAIMVWQQLLAMQPDHLDARKLLREAENRKWLQEGGGTGAKAAAVLRGIGAMAAFVVHMLTKNYDRAMIDCEKVLARDPTCMPMLSGLARAAIKGGHTDVAILTLEYVRDKKPKSHKVLRKLGQLYREKNQIQSAIEAWESVKKLVPNDREAQLELRDLAAEKTMVDGKYETATEKGRTYRESLKNQEDAEDREQAQKIIRTEEDLEQAIQRVGKDVEENPDNKRYVVQLGDLYRRARDYGKAREMYERAQKIDAMDLSIAQRLGTLRIDQLSEQEEKTRAKVKANPDDAEAKSELDRIVKEKFEYSLEEFERQVKAQPTDAGLRAKLGDLLFQAGKYDQAAPHYQRAATDPRLRRRCRKRLGMCLYNTQKYQLAISQFEQAAEGGTAANREVREILYYLALTCEKLGNLDRAEEVLRQIFDADMSYRDVQERLDNLMQQKQSGESPQTQESGETI